MAESHGGTADAPQAFFIYLLATVLTYGLAYRKSWLLILSLLFLIGAAWAKPTVGRLELNRNALKLGGVVLGGTVVWVLLMGWDNVVDVVDRRDYLLWGGIETRLGSGYGTIGTWRRWIRNAFNLPLVHIVGLGLPAAAFACYGLRRACVRSTGIRGCTQATTSCRKPRSSYGSRCANTLGRVLPISGMPTT